MMPRELIWLFIVMIFVVSIACWGIPNHKADGFAQGACAVACDSLKASVESDKCYCEGTNGDKIYKETPRMEK